MNISARDTSKTPFTASFRVDDIITKRSLASLKRSLHAMRDGQNVYDNFISRLAKDGTDEELLMAQFEKYYEITVPRTQKKIKLKIKSLIENIDNFISLRFKK